MLSGQVGPFDKSRTLSKTTSSYLIVRAQLLVVQKRRQPVTDQSLDGSCHAFCNPILADIGFQTAKV